MIGVLNIREDVDKTVGQNMKISPVILTIRLSLWSGTMHVDLGN